MSHQSELAGRFVPDSPAAWKRLATVLLLGTIGSVGMWSVVVALPGVQKDFGATRGTASLAFTFLMLGFGAGGVLMGRLTDVYGLARAVALGIVLALAGYLLASQAPTIAIFIMAHVLIGLGASATFAPLMAEASHWFDKRRGFAVTVAASGNYLGGALWPPLVNLGMETIGWRHTHLTIGVVSAVAMICALALLRWQTKGATARAHLAASQPRIDLNLSSNALTGLLALAAVACCVAMAMPQVHIVAYCGDLGYGAARGAEMLSLMLGLGIVSRIGSGFLADKIGGIRTLVVGAIMQGVALAFYLAFDSLVSLFVISAMFGLFQGGIVPSYAIIVREAMPANEAATRVGLVIFASLIGMSLGGWVSGVIFDATGSYGAAFANGVAWNAVNVLIVGWLLLRSRRRVAWA